MPEATITVSVFAEFACPRCGAPHSVASHEVQAGVSVTCACGEVVTFSEEDAQGTREQEQREAERVRLALGDN